MDSPAPIVENVTGSGNTASGSFMTALCACLSITACGGVAALGLAFAAYFLPGPGLEPAILSGLCVMGASLIALPGILAGEKKSCTFLAVCGICAAISFTATLPLRDDALLCLGAFAVYAAAMGTTVILARKNEARLENARRLSPLTAWALVPALAFGLMAAGMVHEATVSERVLWGGRAVGGVAAVLCFLAFFGVLRPKFYTNAIYTALFFIWLLVPIAGIEAYMYSEGVSIHSAYAVSDWKWSFAFCGLAFAGTARMIFLRHDLLPGKSWLADIFN